MYKFHDEIPIRTIPPPSWDETLDTTSLDIICYQQNGNDDTETEDCLYINVHTPQVFSAHSKIKYYPNSNFSFLVMMELKGCPSWYSSMVAVLLVVAPEAYTPIAWSTKISFTLLSTTDLDLLVFDTTSG
jgi:hypothetical protein